MELLLGSSLLVSQSPAFAQTAPSETGVKPPIEFINEAQYSYKDVAQNRTYAGSTNMLEAVDGALIDPLGRILGCGGEVLPDYTGFSIALYETNPNDPTETELGRLVNLTPTEFPDVQNNGISRGLAPNLLNTNPFFLSNAGQGSYNFLFDPDKGQIEPGSTYILVINAPPDSIYQERRIKLEIVESTGGIGDNILRYLATSLDGQPITARGGLQISQNVVFVPNAEQVGLDLLSLQLETVLCEPNQIAIAKSADRATASPGDTVLYRLAVRNQSDVAIAGLSFTDRLPRGFKLVENSVRAEVAGEAVEITTVDSASGQHQGQVAMLTTPASLPAQGVMNVIYAAQVTPDALRGDGRNSAIVDGQRTDNAFPLKDGPAIHQLKIRPGILSSYGIILGRVFDDKNFDGEQQRDEPGLPNAVIFLQDGNRIVTDDKGLFSVANVQPGYHSGVLDLSSVPGYDFAPNDYRREFNSDSRLVHLEPSGMVRMNFPVTPLPKEAQ